MPRLLKIPAKITLSFCTLFCLSPCFVFSQDVDTSWVRRYNGPGNGDDQATAIAVDSSGNVYVTGSSFDDSITGYDFCTIKYLPNGDTVWVRRYNGPVNRDDFAAALTLDDSGNVYVTGTSANNSSSYASDFATIKYTPSGDTLWVRRFSNCGNNVASCDSAVAIAVDNLGFVYVTGFDMECGLDLPLSRYVTIKYSPDGNTQWINCFGTLWFHFARALALDRNGNVYVTGSRDTNSSGGHADFLTFKYGSGGNFLWEADYNGPANNDDFARAIAVDSIGNAFITGESSGDYATIKYLPNGDTAWVRRYSGPGGFGDYAYAIEVDGSGNVYVTGESNGAGTSQDFATIKYYSNGDTAWVRRYNGPGNDNEERPSLAIDNSGNVHITGRSAGGGSVYDYATIKYDSLGNQVWVARYNGPAHSDDHSYAIAVDALGNVYVTGRSHNGISYDYATIKYATLPQIRGDLNLDGVLDPFDVVLSLNCTFLGEAPPAAPAACDINCDGKITPADVVILLLMVFAAAPAPC